MKIKILLFFLAVFIFPGQISAQDISLYQQFNGRYDFTFIGNTLNPIENSFQTFPSVYTSATANLNLGTNDAIEKAYLYWAGCGTGDFEVKLNGTDMTPERTFAYQRMQSGNLYHYFSAFKDVTDLVQAQGNGDYTLSDLDVSDFIDYHFTNSTNFAGWAIIIVYKNPVLPLNQLNVYDGMQAVPDEINITLSSLNVIDNEDAKIGFLAWEGDSGIQVNETLSINENPLSNPPLNPVNNAFNGTNSFTNSNQLYNMDLDVYNIQDNIQVGDSIANIRLTSGQDVVMVNAIVTKLNSQLPDATVAINNVHTECGSRVVVVDYTVANFNSTDVLQAGTPISIYANGILVDYDETIAPLAIGESVTYQLSITIPEDIPDDFTLVFDADDNGNGVGIVKELNETNNTAQMAVSLLQLPEFNALENLISCNQGLTSGTFDFSDYAAFVKVNPTDAVSFYENPEDAENGLNQIYNPGNYFSQVTPKQIFIRIDNGNCHSITSFFLIVRNCPPTVYNYISANDDGTNDSFFIKGLRDIFIDFQLEIYNRWGVLIWHGNNQTEDWKGLATKGYLPNGNLVPDGTYFYVLDLNDPDYTAPLTGFLYINR